MRILIIINNDGGLYKFRKELIERLAHEGDEVFIVLPEGPYIPRLIACGCSFINVSIDRRGTNIWKDTEMLCTLIKALKNVRPDVVLTYTIKPNVYGGLACQMLGVPYIANITGLGTAVENPGPLQKFALFLYRLGLRKARCVFFQNKENQEFMVSRRIIKGKYRLIPGSGVNLDRFSILPYPAEDIINFVFIARIMKEKGIEEYIAAARYIRAKYPNTSFHVCGFCEEKYEETLQNLCEQGVIQYHGMVDDVREILRNTHCTIHPSYSEGMANVLLESCATARPIITTNRPGCREVIDDGVNGYLVKAKDTNDLIEKIELFLRLPHDEKVSMGMAGRHKVEKEFDRNLVTEAYLEQLETPIL